MRLIFFLSQFIYKGEISVTLAQVPSLLKAASSLKVIGDLGYISMIALFTFENSCEKQD